MSLLQSALRGFGALACGMSKRHILGGKFRREKLWYQTCRRCGKVKETTEPKKRVAK